ncbi:hypothetical protein ACM66B_000466 [Microbotryomycetes sp. NB124-2]
MPSVEDPHTGETTTDIALALRHVETFWQQHFTPDARDATATAAMRKTLLDPIRNAPVAAELVFKLSEPSPVRERKRAAAAPHKRFARRFTDAHNDSLDAPFTADEFVVAIGQAGLGRSPGPSGLPYEMYKSRPHLFGNLLARVFNQLWQDGRLTESMGLSHVRSLFKEGKRGARKSSLKFWRPITLPIPGPQHGFMKGRQSSDAGTHLRLLVEEGVRRPAQDAALLSLDQASAYDLVDHDWIFEVFRAFGARDRFIDLLKLVYDKRTFKSRYILNGFLSDPVTIKCGLGQGDPLSCSVWSVTFQPFLDALVRRQIAVPMRDRNDLKLSQTFSYLAFADDTVLLAAGARVFDRIDELARDWRLATNGRFNTDKTEVLPLGDAWRTPAGISSLQRGEHMRWCGFFVSREGEVPLAWANLLEVVRQKVKCTESRTLTMRGRALYANRYIISRIRHQLSYDIPPSVFVDECVKTLYLFVVGDEGARQRTTPRLTYTDRPRGGLGLIDVRHLITAVSLRLWDAVSTTVPVIWKELARASLGDERWRVWGWLVAKPTKRTGLSRRWQEVAKTIMMHKPSLISPSTLPLESLTLLPPDVLLPPASSYAEDDADRDIRLALGKWRLVLDFYGTRIPGQRHAAGIWAMTRHWETLRRKHRMLVGETTATIEARLDRTPLKLLPASRVELLSLKRPYTTTKVRQALAADEYSVLQTQWLPKTVDKRTEFWRWFNGGGVPAAALETYWRVLHETTSTPFTLHLHGRAPESSCLHCLNGAETREQTDKLDHALVKCPHSVEFWRHVGTILEKELGTTLSVDDKSPEQAIRGYERVRSKNKRAKDKEGRKLVRKVVCLALHQLVKARNRLHGTDDPQPLPPAHRLAHQLTLELRRLDRYVRAT